jgi:hypothetical protein
MGIGGVRGSFGWLEEEARGAEGEGAVRLGLREDEGPGEPGRREDEEGEEGGLMETIGDRIGEKN